MTGTGVFNTEIPRLLHQTARSDDLPPAIAENVAALRDANPEWQYRLYDDSAVARYILDHYGRTVLRTFERIDPSYGAARADLFRYLLMYQAGGIYLDVKSRFVRPIASVIRGDEGFILSQWRNTPDQSHADWGLHDEIADVAGGEFQQWHIIAAPGHPFLQAVIERVLHGIESYRVRTDETGWLGVLRLTGPIAYTLAIAPLLGRYPARRIRDESVIGLDYNVLGASNHKRLFGQHYTDNTLPVVRRAGMGGMMDRAYVEVRARKRRWLDHRRPSPD